MLWSPPVPFIPYGHLPALHRGAFCQFPFQWIYHCHSSKSIGKETGKTHLCALVEITAFRMERIFQPTRALEFIPGEVVFNPAYN